MNFWEDKNQFWTNKLRDNDIYIRQKNEIAQDITEILSTNNWKTILDVGGHKGELKEYLPKTYRQHYHYIDYQNGYDFLKPWEDQKIRKKYDIIITSLTLLCIDPQYLSNLLKEIYAHAQYAVYFYEESPRGKKHGEKINDNYGGKWVVTMPGLIGDNMANLSFISSEPSKVNPDSWTKYRFYIKQTDDSLTKLL